MKVVNNFVNSDLDAQTIDMSQCEGCNQDRRDFGSCCIQRLCFSAQSCQSPYKPSWHLGANAAHGVIHREESTGLLSRRIKKKKNHIRQICRK